MATIKYLGNNKKVVICTETELLMVIDLFKLQLVDNINPAAPTDDGRTTVTIFSDDCFPDPDPTDILAKAGLIG